MPVQVEVCNFLVVRVRTGHSPAFGESRLPAARPQICRCVLFCNDGNRKRLLSGWLSLMRLTSFSMSVSVARFLLVHARCTSCVPLVLGPVSGPSLWDMNTEGRRHGALLGLTKGNAPGTGFQGILVLDAKGATSGHPGAL